MPKKSSNVLTVGSKIQVWNGSAKHTSGGLKKADLMLNAKGKVVSKRKHAASLKTASNLGAFLHKKGSRKLQGLDAFANAGAPFPGQKGSGFISDALGAIGLGLPRKRVARPRRRTVKGGNLFGDIMDGVGKVVDVGSKILPLVAGAGLRKPRRMKGGSAYVELGGRVARPRPRRV